MQGQILDLLAMLRNERGSVDETVARLRLKQQFAQARALEMQRRKQKQEKNVHRRREARLSCSWHTTRDTAGHVKFPAAPIYLMTDT